MPSRPAINVGARFRQISGGSGVWVVVGFAADHAGNPHARLALEGDRTRVITIAVAALQDRRLYERMAGNSDIDNGTEDGIVGYVGLEPGQSS